MRKILVACAFIILALPLDAFLDDDRTISVGLHGLDALIGNYGFTTSILLARHVELTLPLEFYSFSHSLPGSITLKMAHRVAERNGVSSLPKLQMKHYRMGVGVRLFFAPRAMSSGFYVQPLLYGGWMQNSDFANVEFDNRKEIISAVAKTIYSDLPIRNYFALTPQLNIGYQWIFDWGIMAQIAASCNYVYAPGAVSIFDASNRFFSSRVVPAGTKSQLPHNAMSILRAFGTQMPGLHAGISLNVGMAF